MEKNTIIKKAYFDTYAFYQPYGHFKYLHKTKSEINIFGSQTALCISSNKIDGYIWFGISNDIFNTKKVNYDFESSISLSQIQELSEIVKSFDISVENNYFLFQKKRYKTLSILFQFYLDSVYMMICSSKRSREAQTPAEDTYGDDILYIHGIWEVELSEEFKKKISGTNPRSA